MAGISFRNDLTYMLSRIDLADEKQVQFPIAFNDEFKKKPIEELYLKARGTNVLKRNKIMSIGDLLERFDDLLKMRNCGVDTAKEIKNRLLQLWYESVDEPTRNEFWTEFVKANAAA